MGALPKNSWLLSSRRGASDGTPMLFFPPAGGSAETVAMWVEVARPQLELAAIRLPGRGVRLREPAIESMAQLIDAIGSAVGPELPADYYAFGSCLGGLLAFELVRWLAARGLPPPRRLIISGCGSPATEATSSRLADASDAELIDQLRRWQGMTEAALANPQIVAMALPPLRADLRLLAGYTAGAPTAAPIATPITTVRGRDDTTTTAEAVRDWQRFTTAFRYREVPGGHFPDPALVLAALRDDLGADAS